MRNINKCDIHLLEDRKEFGRIATEVVQRIMQSPEETHLALKAIYAQQFQNADGSPGQIDEVPFVEIDSQGRRHPRIPSIFGGIDIIRGTTPTPRLNEIPTSEYK